MPVLHTPAEIVYLSSLAHHVEGIMLACTGMALLAATFRNQPQGRERYFLPAAALFGGFLLLGFLFYGSYTRPDRAWYWIISDIQQRQHLMAAALLVFGSSCAILGLKFDKLWVQAGLPVSVMAVGAVFLAHPQHGSGAEAVRVLVLHWIFGAALVGGGFTQALALYRHEARRLLLRITAGGLFLAGLSFAIYQEPAASFASFHCPRAGTAREIIIKNNEMTPNHVFGSVCDTLTIKNQDDTTRLIAFGQHSHHQQYGAVGETFLDKNQSVTITFIETGTFVIHDHIHDEVEGQFTVAR